MEALLRLLPGPQPLPVRYGVSVILVVLTFALRLGIEDRAGPYGFVLFIPAIMVSALMYTAAVVSSPWPRPSQGSLLCCPGALTLMPILLQSPALQWLGRLSC